MEKKFGKLVSNVGKNAKDILEKGKLRWKRGVVSVIIIGVSCGNPAA